MSREWFHGVSHGPQDSWRNKIIHAGCSSNMTLEQVWQHNLETSWDDSLCSLPTLAAIMHRGRLHGDSHVPLDMIMLTDLCVVTWECRTTCTRRQTLAAVMSRGWLHGVTHGPQKFTTCLQSYTCRPIIRHDPSRHMQHKNIKTQVTTVNVINTLAAIMHRGWLHGDSHVPQDPWCLTMISGSHLL